MNWLVFVQTIGLTAVLIAVNWQRLNWVMVVVFFAVALLLSAASYAHSNNPPDGED